MKELCSNNHIILLQETWLYPDECNTYLSNIHADFTAYGTSPMDCNKGLLRGRPYGGIGFMWHKSIANKCKIVTYDDPRIIGLELNCSSHKILLLNVYLPYESHDNYDTYMSYLVKIQQLVVGADTPYVYVIGDWNADILNRSRFGRELLEMCTDSDLYVSDKTLLPGDTYSFISKAHGTCSWLDHCIATTSGHNIIQELKFNYDSVASDHFPLEMSIKCNITPICDNDIEDVKIHDWSCIDQDIINQYYGVTQNILSKIEIPHDLFLCTKNKCEVHNASITKFYEDIMNALRESTAKCIPSKRPSQGHCVPGWNMYAKEAHIVARDDFHLWTMYGKPRVGNMYENMKRSRARFKYALRYCKQNEDTMKANVLASEMSNYEYKEFWKNVKRMNSSKLPAANTIDGVCGSKNIANFWKDHFQNILNSSKDVVCKAEVSDIITNSAEDVQMQMINVSAVDIQDIMKKLCKGKAAGPDTLPAEAFIYANPYLYVLLSLCFTAIFRHSFIPEEMLDTMIIPLIKNKGGNLSDSNNYRPVALANIASKILEHVILDLCEPFLYTSDNQFGFKPAHSTDICIYALREIFEYYKLRNTTVFITFLDASKAFDLLNYWSLFKKLLHRGMPLYIVKVLIFWYVHQNMFVRWGQSCSTKFKVSNGVKQGGILSPKLFNVYMDELSLLLSNSKDGPRMSGTVVNHLGYADDLCLISLSSAGMQNLLDICHEYAKKI